MQQNSLSKLKEDLRAEPLRIGVSTRALFNLEKEHRIFNTEGVTAYVEYQRNNENQTIEKGSGFEVIKRLLSLNEEQGKPFVEVVLLSRNSPDLSVRAFKSVDAHGLNIKLGSFTSGRPTAPFVSAWKIDLFLSNDSSDVQNASDAGTAAARLGAIPTIHEAIGPNDEVRFAFDGDAVLFSPESDEIYKKKGLEFFLNHEKENAKNPMGAGPFKQFLHKLSKLRKIYLDETGVSRVRIGIVTARNAPAHERVIHTLRVWDTPADEAHFVGPNTKAPILESMDAHIFFDDQKKHVEEASGVVSSAHVPGPHKDEAPVIPSG